MFDGIDKILTDLTGQQGKLVDSTIIRHRINVALDITEKCLKYDKKPEEVIKLFQDVVKKMERK